MITKEEEEMLNFINSILFPSNTVNTIMINPVWEAQKFLEYQIKKEKMLLIWKDFFKKINKK
jgi:hypothetical protein